MQRSHFVDRAYQLESPLGEGGMGAVYKATQLLDGNVLALKLVSSDLAENEAGRTQGLLPGEAAFAKRLALAREFQTLASLHHPNVIRVLSYGFDEKLGPYFTMELLEKPATLLEAAFDHSITGKILLVGQLLRALSYIHHRGVVHRDIKPSNVLVVGGEVKLLDFGIATALEQSTDIAGTTEYMAPELFGGAQPTPQSDLYAVGVLLHQLLAGRLPQLAVTTQQDAPTELESSLVGQDGAAGSHPPAATTLPDVPRVNVSSLTAMLDRMESVEFSEQSGEEVQVDIPGALGDVTRRLLRRQAHERYLDCETVLVDLATAADVPIPIETSETRESFISASVLVGRDAEIDALRTALEEARQHQGRLVLIGGESGVGKSRLVAELRTLALVHGCWVAEGQSVTEGGAYYQEWLPLLRALAFRTDMNDAEAAILLDIVPDLSELLNRPIPAPPPVRPEEAQARIAATVIALLRRLHRPLLMLFEDLHWARTESLTLLKLIAAQASEMPILLLATYRSDESPDLPLTFGSCRHLTLQRLTEGDIARLSVSMLGAFGQRKDVVEYLARQTEGNVFFLVEIVRALAENAGALRLISEGELPEHMLTDGIGRIVERRVERIPVAYQPILEFAATLGRKLDLRVIASAFPNMALRPMLMSGANVAVLESQGEEWRFAHDKLRETILRRIPTERRQGLHLQVARSLEATYTGSERLAKSALLAYHYSQAGAHSAALGYWISAGDSAAKLCLFEEARRHYASARTTLGYLPETPELRRQLVDVILRQVQTGLTNDANEVQLKRLADTRSVLEQLAQSGDALPEDRLRMARVDYYYGRVYHYSGQPTKAIPHFRLVLPIAEEFGDRELLVMPSYVIGLALCMQGQFGKAQELLAQATTPIEGLLGISVDTIRCVMYHCIALAASGQYRRAILAMERARPWARDSEQLVYQGTYLTLEAVAAIVAADWPATIRISERVLEIGEKTKERLFIYSPMDFMAWAQSFLGMHTQAAENRAKAKEMRRSIGGGIVRDWFEAAEAEILLNAGQTEAGLRQAQSVAKSSQEAGLPFSHAIAERMWGCALSRLGGDRAEFDAHFVKSLEICKSADQVMNAAQTELWWGRIYRERGDEAEAQVHFDRAVRQMTAGEYEYALLEARRTVERAS